MQENVLGDSAERQGISKEMAGEPARVKKDVSGEVQHCTLVLRLATGG